MGWLRPEGVDKLIQPEGEASQNFIGGGGKSTCSGGSLTLPSETRPKKNLRGGGSPSHFGCGQSSTSLRNGALFGRAYPYSFTMLDPPMDWDAGEVHAV